MAMAKKTKACKKDMGKKFHYYFVFKTGNYFDVSRKLEDKFPELFCGSGTCLVGKGYDVSFLCDENEEKKIVAFIKKEWKGRKFEIVKDDA
jgi:hypothetical protein